MRQQVVLAGLFVIYAAVFSYLADVYGSATPHLRTTSLTLLRFPGPFASSALAGQSLARNVAGAVFPLFCTQLFAAIGFPWGNTLFAALAVLLGPVPYVCFSIYGERIGLTRLIGVVLLWAKAEGEEQVCEYCKALRGADTCMIG
jgi:hypothetical protein